MILDQTVDRKVRSFALSPAFIEDYQGRQPKWGYDGLGYFTFKRCVGVSTPVLCDDLQWRPAGDLKVGQGIVGFDANVEGRGRFRHLRHGVILHNKTEKAQTFGVELEDGTILYATPDHGWLVKLSETDNRLYWKETKDLAATHKGGAVHLLRPFGPVWEPDVSFEGGYISAAYDGEGCLDRHNSIQFIQVQNEMLDQVRDFLIQKGVPFTQSSRKKVEGRKQVFVLRTSGRQSFYRVLGRFQPHRLVAKFTERLKSKGGGALRTSPEDYVKVVRVFDAGERDIAVISTSTETHFTGGFASHNTYARPTCDCEDPTVCGHPTEEWWETCKRVVEGVYNVQKVHCRRFNLPWSERKAQRSAQEMFRRMWDFKFTPPGRGLSMMGTLFMWEKGGAALNSCAYTSTQGIDRDFAGPFTFLMDMSMLGVGVGGDTLGAGRVKLQKPRLAEDAYVVPDTREGWVSLTRVVLDSFVGKGRFPLDIDFSQIRPAGQIIRGFGGVSSGPGPLAKLVRNIVRTLLPEGITPHFEESHNEENGEVTHLYTQMQGEGEPYRITSGRITDVFNMVGACVVAGGVRRSAELMLGNKDDEEFRKLKDPSEIIELGDHISSLQEQLLTASSAARTSLQADIGALQKKIDEHPLRSHRWASNNSIFGEVGMDYTEVGESIAKNGEPGIFWLKNAQDYGRMIDPPNYKDRKAQGCNPCFVGDTLIATADGRGAVPIKQLVDEGNDVPVYSMDPKTGKVEIKIGRNPRLTRESSPLVEVELDDGSTFRVTPDHKMILLDGTHCEAKDLQPGDSLPGFQKGASDLEGEARWSKAFSEASKRGHRAGDRVSDPVFFAKLLKAHTVADDLEREASSKHMSSQRRAELLAYYKEQEAKTDLETVWMGERLYAVRSCETCGEEFVVAWRMRGQSYCSHACLNKAESHIKKRRAGQDVAQEYNHRVKAVRHLDVEEPVYNLSVTDHHTVCLVTSGNPKGQCSGLVTAQCAEQTLESHEICCLVETYPAHHDSYEDFQRTLKFAYLYAKSVTLLGTHDPLTNAVVVRNRRIGCSMSGIRQAIEKVGRRAFLNWADQGYHYIDELDQMYSDWLGIPRSIKMTSVKPSGCRPWYALTSTDKGLLTLEDLFEHHPVDQEWADMPGAGTFEGPVALRSGPISKTYNNGVNPVLRITTSYGIEVESTPNHQWWVSKRYDRKKSEKYQDVNAWRRADEIQPGDILDIQPGTYNKEGGAKLARLNSLALNMRGDASEIQQPEYMNPSLAWMLGYLWGDGAMSPSKYRLRWIDARRENLEKVQGVLKDQFGLETKIHQASEHRKAETLEVGSKHLWHWLIRNDVFKLYAGKIDVIPKVVRASGQEEVLAFLAGLLDSDGWAGMTEQGAKLVWTMADKFFAQHVQDVALAVGLVLGRSHITGGSSFQEHRSMYHLTQSVHVDERGFNLFRRHSTKVASVEARSDFPGWHCLKDRGHGGLILGKVTKVESAGVMPTFDVEVEGEHWYYAGAIKSHNTVSLLCGATPGIHAPHSPYYIRNVRVGAHSPLLKAAQGAGYKVEPDAYADNTFVVSFPVKTENCSVGKRDVSIWEQVALAADLQRYWADNQVSVTVTFKPEEARDIPVVLETFEDRLKAISFLPLLDDHGYVQAPYIEITEEEYKDMVKDIRPMDLSGTKNDQQDLFCDGDKCVINPV